MPQLSLVHKRGPEAGATKSELSAFQIAQYLATLILGAGVFLIPLEAAQIGLIPLLGMLVLILWPCIRLYQRVATLMVRPDTRPSGGGEALARAVVEAGAGRSGAVLSLLGIAVYVVGAAIVYNRLALPSLELLAAQLGGSIVAGTAVGGASLAGLFVSSRISARRVITRRLMTITSVWGITTPALALLSTVKPAAQAVGLLGFAAGCLLVSHCPAAKDVADRAGKLTAGHSSSVAGLRLQLGLMSVLAVTAISVVAFSLHHAIHWNAVWVADNFHPSALLGAAAVILFAHVGTGMSNIADYAEMGSAAFRKSAVRLSLLLVTVVLVAWALPTVLIFGHAGLANLVDAKTNSALGLPSAITGSGTAINGAMSVLAAMITLIAVTNACAGFVTSLAREVIGATHEIRPETTMPRESSLIIALIVALGAVAGGTMAADNSLAPMLHIAGIVGGGVIVFTLPLLAETGDRKRRARFGLGASCVAATLGAWATAAALTEGHTSLPVQLTMVVIGWSPLIPTLLAARGVIRASDSDEQPAITVYLGPTVPTRPPIPVTAMSASREQVRGRR